MPLPATPWLQPPETADKYLKGYSLGQQVAGEQAQIVVAQQRLQQQAQQTQMEMEARKAEQDRNYLMDQQKLEIEKAYRQSQMGMEKQKLDEASQMNQFKIKQAADMSSAKMEASQRIAAGEDPASVWMDVGPRAGITGSGLAGLVKAKQASVPKDLELRNKGDRTFYRSSATEPYKLAGGSEADKVLAHAPAIAAFKDISQMKKDASVMKEGSKEKKAKLSEIEQEKAGINSLYKSKGMPEPYPGAQPAGLPMPKSKEDLVKDQVYQTKRGPATWDGEQFIPE